MKHGNLSLHRLVILTGLLISSVFSLSAQSETIDCTAITSLPYTISAQGVYCFTGNLSTNITLGNAITINANNVTIDLNGYKLGGLTAGDDTKAYGIYTHQHKNITIKNGIIRGFSVAIVLSDDSPYTASSGNVVTGILADQNTWVGILVAGFGNTVSKNTVVDTGGATWINEAYGITVFGPGAKVVNNEISKTTAQTSGYARGMDLQSADYSLVLNNTVTDTITDTGTGYAVYIANSTGVFLRTNNLSNADNGLYFTGSTGKYFNNLTFDVATPFTGGTPIGGNND